MLAAQMTPRRALNQRGPPFVAHRATAVAAVYMPVSVLVPGMTPRSGSRPVQLPAPEDHADEIMTFTAEEPLIDRRVAVD